MSSKIPLPHSSQSPFQHTFPAWGVDLKESHHADNWSMAPTSHDFLKLVFVTGGQGFMNCADRDQHPFAKGNLLVIPPGLNHALVDSPSTPTQIYVLSIQLQVLSVAALDLACLPEGVLTLDAEQTTKLEKTLRRILFEQGLATPQTGARIIGLTLRLLTELSYLKPTAETLADPTNVPRWPVQDPARLDATARVRSYVQDLDEHFFEATDLDDASARLSLSRRRFTQLFRQVTGSSWLVYVRRLRVSHARRLMAQTNRTVLSVAFECGFEDLSTFYRTFKREVGVSPNTWREQHGTGKP